MSLRTRLAIILGATVAITVALAGVAAYVLARNELDASSDRFLQSRAQSMTDVGARLAGDDGFPRRRELRRPGQFDVERSDILVQVLNEDGEIQTNSFGGDLPVGPTELAVLEAGLDEAMVGPDVTNRPQSTRDVEVDGVHYRMLTVGYPNGAVQLAQDVSADDEVLASFRTRLFGLGLAGSAVAAALGWFIAGRTVRPVRRLTGAAEHIAATHELTEAIPVEGGDEVGRLARAFNEMLEALSQSRAQQQRLIEDASHELRTPLTSLRTNAEVLREADRLDEADRDRLLDDVTNEVVELGELVNELVELAQDPTPDGQPLQGVDLAEIVTDAVERTRRRTERTIELSIESAPSAAGTTLLGDAAQLSRAVSNLLANATKFSPDAQPIEVRLRGLRLEVIDHGPGIGVDERPRAFERFWRSERDRSKPGSGLGLAIVDQIVRAHAGSTFIADTPGGGATVGFELGTTHGNER